MPQYLKLSNLINDLMRKSYACAVIAKQLPLQVNYFEIIQAYYHSGATIPKSFILRLRYFDGHLIVDHMTDRCRLHREIELSRKLATRKD